MSLKFSFWFFGICWLSCLIFSRYSTRYSILSFTSIAISLSFQYSSISIKFASGTYSWSYGFTVRIHQSERISCFRSEHLTMQWYVPDSKSSPNSMSNLNSLRRLTITRSPLSRYQVYDKFFFPANFPPATHLITPASPFKNQFFLVGG